MKRIFKIFLTVLLFASYFSFSNLNKINADIGMVNWDPYYAWCIKKEGLVISMGGYGRENVYIPYGARLYIWHGSNDQRAYSVNDSYFAYYGEYSFSFSTSIKGSDIRPLKKNPDSEFLTYENLELQAIEEIKIYSGPSSDYEKVKTLPAGSTIESDYNDGMWAHVVEGDDEGWIYFNQTSKEDDLPKAIIKSSDKLFISNLNETTLYNSVDEKRGEITKIPASSSIEYLGRAGSSFSRYYYVNYDEYNGWLIDEGDNFVFDIPGTKMHPYSEIVIYEDLDSESIVGVIQSNEEVDVLKTLFDSEGKRRYLCKNDEYTGWTKADPNCFVDFNIDRGFEKAFVEEEAVIFESINGNKTEQILEKGEEFLLIDSIDNNGMEWHYIKNASKEGWINKEISFYDHEDTTDIQEENEIRQTTKTSIPSVVYYYVAGAFIISISTFVLIRYLNLKKK